MAIIDNIAHYWNHIIYIKNPIVDRIFQFINNINIVKFFITICFFYTVGTFVNFYVPFPKFHLFQCLFTTIFIIAFISIRHFEKQMKELHRMMAGDKGLHRVNDKIDRLRRSALNIIIPPIAGAFFGMLAVLLVNVNIRSLSAIYLIIVYTICDLVSFLGYLQYVYLAIYIVRLGNSKRIDIYDKEYPSNTGWINTLTKLYCRYRNTFFILGMLYIFGVIYFVLCGAFRVMEKLTMYPILWFALLLFWGGVLCAIVILFPTVSILEYIYIKKIIGNLKTQTVIDINKSIANNPNDIQIKLQKSYLIIAIMNTPDYPFKDAIGVVFSSIMTTINLAASVAAILQLAIV